MKIRLISLILVFIAALAACSSDDDRLQDMSEKELYDNAQESLADESFSVAIKNLQLLEARYPFGAYAEQAQLEIIYAHYRNFEPEAAIAAADRFIRLHPLHSNVDYAYYMKGLANYADSEGFLDRFLPTDMTERDPGAALQSFGDFRQLLARYPDSPYAPDAQARMLYLRARLARYEINNANYYFSRGAYIAAVNRGRYVVENYPQTPAVADALAVMTQGYLLLGKNELAQDSLSVLSLNYPDHPSLDKNGKFKNEFKLRQNYRSWVNILTLGLFDRSTPPKFDNRAPYLVP
jgi:outer membrane protein assembly factor BamD